MGMGEDAEFRIDRAGMNMYHPNRTVCYYWNEVSPRIRPGCGSHGRPLHGEEELKLLNLR